MFTDVCDLHVFRNRLMFFWNPFSKPSRVAGMEEPPTEPLKGTRSSNLSQRILFIENMFHKPRANNML
jgi:hypothetical protein